MVSCSMGAVSATMSTNTRIPLIISVDDHVVEPPHLWQRWLPARYRGRGPRVVQAGCRYERSSGAYVETMTDEGPKVDWWVYEDVRRSLPNQQHKAGRDLHEEGYFAISFADMRPGLYDPGARLQDMSANHTERSMCFPNIVPRFCGQTFLEGKDKELGMACVEAYNEWMLDEWCGDSGGRLIPLCLIPLWNPDAAATMVRANAARGCRAIAFTELPANLGLPTLYDPDRYWDPLFRACDETGTVICMHIGSGSKMPTSSLDAPPAVRVALSIQNAMASLTDWLLSGTLLRFPNIKVAYSESQIGWMPFMFERIDNVFLKTSEWGELDPILNDLPSSQIPGRVYGCFFEDAFGLQVRDAVGIDQIVFEVDYPHQDTTWPSSLAYLEKITASLTDHEIYKIVRGNAIEMLGLDPELPDGR
jgi:predicted TIM-barrel fold metal-dependent hydrolase